MTTKVEVEVESDARKLRKALLFLPLRFVNIFFCLILTLYGVGIFLLTITVRIELSGYMEFLYYYLEKPIIVLIMGSIILVGLGCLGIISTVLNIYQGIVTFGVLLFGLFMFKLTMCAVALATLGSADLSLTQALEFHITNYTANYTSNNTEPMDYIQTELSCCGMTDFADWNSTLGFIPGSCCDSDSACGFADVLSLNEIGCYEALKSLVNYLITYLAVILGVLAILQITTMTITVFLARGIANIRRRVSACGNESDEDDGNSVSVKPESAVPIQNPLGVRRLVPLKDNDKSSLRSTATPHRVKIFGGQPLPGFVPTRNDSFLRHPVNGNVSFGYADNPSRRIITPTAPPLPITSRRFPTGF